MDYVYRVLKGLICFRLVLINDFTYSIHTIIGLSSFSIINQCDFVTLLTWRDFDSVVYFTEV